MINPNTQPATEALLPLYKQFLNAASRYIEESEGKDALAPVTDIVQRAECLTKARMAAEIAFIAASKLDRMVLEAVIQRLNELIQSLGGVPAKVKLNGKSAKPVVNAPLAIPVKTPLVSFAAQPVEKLPA